MEKVDSERGYDLYLMIQENFRLVNDCEGNSVSQRM